MRYQRVFIDSIGYDLPNTVVTTADLESRLDPLLRKLSIPKGHIETITGIRERRWWPESHSLADGATTAARKALDKTSIPIDEIDAVIYSGVCREYFEPATACHVASNLGIHDGAFVYDISNACLGVLNGIVDLANRIELGQIRCGLVVAAESAREVTEDIIRGMLKDQSVQNFASSVASLTGGSGACAVLVSDGSFGGTPHRLLGGMAKNSSRFHELCRWGMREVREGFFEQFMTTDAPSVLRNGLDLGLRTWQALMQELGWCKETVSRIITHQIGKAHRQSFMDALSLGESLDFPTYPYLGNIGTVSLPISMALAEERQKIREGDRVGMLGIGSGLNCLMLGVQW